MSQTPADDEPDGLSGPRLVWAVVSICLSVMMTVLDSSIANIALPAIARDFGASPANSIWIVNAYQLAIVVTLLPLASLGEIVGYRRVYLIGLGVFTVASLSCALSHDLVSLTAARTLQGLGASGVMSVNIALIRFVWPGRLLGRGIGLNAMVVSAAAAVGPSVASAILAVGPWPWLFAVNIPVGLLAFSVALRALPSNPLSGRRFDIWSAMLNALTLGLLITGIDVITRARNKIVGALELAAGAVFGALLVAREWSLARPLVPLDLMRNRVFALSVATSSATFAAQMLALVALPFHFQDSLGLSQVATGLVMTPWPATVSLTAMLAGALSDRLPTPALVTGGLAILAAGLVALALIGGHPSMFDIVWRMALAGFGFGLFQTPNNRMMQAASPRERAGAAGGMLSMARLVGQTTGAVLTATLLHTMGAAGEVAALWVAAGFALTGAAVSLLRLEGPQVAPT